VSGRHRIQVIYGDRRGHADRVPERLALGVTEREVLAVLVEQLQ
jgi:hypothetical protein